MEFCRKNQQIFIIFRKFTEFLLACIDLEKTHMLKVKRRDIMKKKSMDKQNQKDEITIADSNVNEVTGDSINEHRTLEMANMILQNPEEME